MYIMLNKILSSDLPSQVVTASSVNSFKSRLDNYWHQIGSGFSQA